MKLTTDEARRVQKWEDRLSNARQHPMGMWPCLVTDGLSVPPALLGSARGLSSQADQRFLAGMRSRLSGDEACFTHLMEVSGHHPEDNAGNFARWRASARARLAACLCGDAEDGTAERAPTVVTSCALVTQEGAVHVPLHVALIKSASADGATQHRPSLATALIPTDDDWWRGFDRVVNALPRAVDRANAGGCTLEWSLDLRLWFAGLSVDESDDPRQWAASFRTRTIRGASASGAFALAAAQLLALRRHD